jgi:hypothetical protein
MDFYVNNMMNLKYILIIYIFNNIGPPFYVSHRGLQNLETGLHISFMDNFYFVIRRSNQDGGSNKVHSTIFRQVFIFSLIYH